MEFKWGAKRFSLHRISSNSVREIKGKRVETVKDEEIQLHIIYVYEDSA